MGNVTVEVSAEVCGSKCKSTQGCKSFLYKPRPDVGKSADESQNDKELQQGSCILLSYNDWCKRVRGVAWDLYSLCPIPESELVDCLPAGLGPVGFHSQHWEDRHLLKSFFCQAYNKTFLEIGGFDGDKYSNTKFLEDTMGWHGVIIEAQPESARRLQKNRGGNPKNHIFAEGVCTPELGKNNGTLTFWGPGESTAGIPELQSEEFKKQWFSNPEQQVQYEVPCETIASMLGKANVTHLTFFSLDVEGAEQMVLQTMDWNVTVCVWLVEMDGTNQKKDEAVEKFLVGNGYVRSDVRFWEEDRSDGYDGGGDNAAFVHADLESCLKL